MWASTRVEPGFHVEPRPEAAPSCATLCGQSGILRPIRRPRSAPTPAGKRMPRAARWNVRKGATDRRMELSIPWTVARPLADHPQARRSQGLTADDSDLVGRAREGDQVAFARLFEHYHAPILNYLHRMVGDRAMAEDLTQDTFIKAYNALPSRARPGFQAVALPDRHQYRHQPAATAQDRAVDSVPAWPRPCHELSIEADRSAGARISSRPSPGCPTALRCGSAAAPLPGAVARRNRRRPWHH